MEMEIASGRAEVSQKAAELARLAAEKLHGFCLEYPGAACLMLRKAREWTARSIVAFYAQTVVGNDPRVKFSNGTFRYDNGSVVYSGGMLDERQREAVRSIGGAGGLELSGEGHSASSVLASSVLMASTWA
jgi:hypothetical protein